MNGTDGKSGESTAERALWLRSQATEAPEDEAGYFLDLAAFADGRLDDEEAERVAAWLAADPQAAGDVAAARAPALALADDVEIARVIARACGLPTQPAPGSGRVLLFAWPILRRNAVRRLAEWSSLAAALAMVGWLGFAMGSDASLAFGQSGQSNEPVSLHELIDPGSGILHDLGVELQT
jgi:anti-sigma factor RsiW